MERIVAKSLLNHLTSNNFLSKVQHGFVQRRSTCTNLMECINDWTLTVQDGHSVPVVYIDFNKAFDCVSHSKLFARFSDYGIDGDLLEWLQSFFSNRTHHTKVGTMLSSLVGLMIGVTQGSGTGPVAFITFLDDLARRLENHGVKLKVFADDVKVYLSVCNSDRAVVLQTALNCIHVWANEWQLPISISKCNVLTIGKPELNIPYHINNNVLPVVTSCRDLGVTITNDLIPTMHINETVRKAHQRANAILRCFTTRECFIGQCF